MGAMVGLELEKCRDMLPSLDVDWLDGCGGGAAALLTAVVTALDWILEDGRRRRTGTLNMSRELGEARALFDSERRIYRM